MIYAADKDGPVAGRKIEVLNLASCGGFAGPGSYVLPLVKRGSAYQVAVPPLDPGVPVPVEASGQKEFRFEHADWRERLDTTKPHWAKVLVRYNVEGDEAMNQRQRDRLLELQAVARGLGIGFLFELLVPPEPEQRGDAFDTEIRPGLVVRAFDELGAAGIEPDMWKIEGLERREDCQAVAERAGAPVVVLGRGADAVAVERWLRAGAGVPNYDGFAIGRSIWWEPCDRYRNGALDREAAVAAVADRYAGYIEVWRTGIA